MKNIRIFLLLFSCVLLLTKCIDSDLDAPPLNGESPNIPEDQIVSITEIVSLWQAGINIEIGLDKYIRGIVVGDDQTGNIYKTLFVQEGDRGISIVVDETDLFNTYPVGREVFVHLQHLWISDFNFLPQLGMAPVDGELSRIPPALIEEILLPGEIFNQVEANTIRISEINESHLNTLVRFEDLEFAGEALNNTFAVSTPTENVSVNHPLEDCDENVLDLRTSGFADFANRTVPSGNGVVHGILGRFGIDGWQLTIRDLEDLDMEAERCNGGGGGNTGGEGLIEIEELLDMFNSGNTIIGDNYIEGIVISDVFAGNINNQNLQIQDGNYGITIRFDEPHGFPLGEKLRIDLGGRELSEFNGQLQVSDLFITRAESLGQEDQPEPRVVTIADILENHDEWESTLVRIDDVTVSGGTTWESINTFSDGTGNITTFIRGSADFSGDSAPSGPVSITGIIGEFNDPQVLLRNEDDIE